MISLFPETTQQTLGLDGTTGTAISSIHFLTVNKTFTLPTHTHKKNYPGNFQQSHISQIKKTDFYITSHADKKIIHNVHSRIKTGSFYGSWLNLLQRPK